MRVLVTGTDTGIGKTTVCALLHAGLEAAGLDAGYFKAAQTGEDDDTATFERLRPSALTLPPSYRLAAPQAPWRAALMEGVSIDLARIGADFAARAARDAWLVEGAGGLTVPLSATMDYRDLARALSLSVLVVASTRLGTINHTRLTVEAACNAGLRVLGVVLNGPPDEGLRGCLDALLAPLSVEVVAECPDLTPLEPTRVAADGRSCFPARTVVALRERAA